jgi:hypothetical protein
MKNKINFRIKYKNKNKERIRQAEIPKEPIKTLQRSHSYHKSKSSEKNNYPKVKSISSKFGHDPKLAFLFNLLM